MNLFKKQAIISILTICASDLTAQSHLPLLENSKQFSAFAGPPLVEKYGEVLSVKVVYDLRSKKLYYLNHQHYRYHHEFCMEQLGYADDHYTFNKQQYAADDYRDYLLGNLNYFKSLNRYILDLSPVDLMKKEFIIQLFEAVSASFFEKNKLTFFINSARLLQERTELEKRLPLILPPEIYKNQTYQAISKGSQTGILRFASMDELQHGTFTGQEILVIPEAPVMLPMVRGFIVQSFQTPLSHISILGQNRRIPVCAYRDAFTDRKLRSWEGKKIKLTVTASSFDIDAYSGLLSAPVIQAPVIPVADLQVQELVDMRSVSKQMRSAVGQKAVQFSELVALSKKVGFKTPESAFAIPFYFYQQHMHASGAEALIASFQKDSLNRLPDSARAILLKQIRQKIKEHPVDPSLLLAIRDKVIYFGSYRRMRFRSSTNAEDANGFSGAGLYVSKTGVVDDSLVSVEKAIRSVWASLWSAAAFQERTYFGIDHQQVYMGILVHRSFPEEQVNGVVITKNLYRDNYYGFVVNAQTGDHSVVDPKSGEITDQFICYPRLEEEIDDARKTVDMITTSSLTNGQLVMSETEIQRLANACDRIK
ncbi:MAG: PEP/pyruvate-binding domain-containing protein, partial [Ferruginibacter sp.]